MGDHRPEASVSRRRFLLGAGKLAAGATLAATTFTTVAQGAPAASEGATFKYKPLDPERVYWDGVGGYYKGACGQASFEAITKNLGEPFTSVPGYALKWGEGGCVGYGSHCGALVGTSTAIALAFGADPAVSTKLIKELNQWYMQDLGSGSVLCHISVTEWSKANGVGVESQDRVDRCARVTGEVAKKAALLMNAEAEGTFKAQFGAAYPSSTSCISCHGKEARSDVRQGVAAQDCAPCHDTAHKR